jgi:hypothetical protein
MDNNLLFSKAQNDTSMKNLNDYFKEVNYPYAIIDRYRIKCPYGHIFKVHQIREYAKQHINCPICSIPDTYVLFKLLDYLKINYKIEEMYTTNKFVTLESKYDRYLQKLVISIYTKSNFLVGVIMFNDVTGECREVAKEMNILFRLFNIDEINNRNYCKEFLKLYIKVANKKLKNIKMIQIGDTEQ